MHVCLHSTPAHRIPNDLRDRKLAPGSLQVRILNGARLGDRVGDLAALLALPVVFAGHEGPDGSLDLGAQVSAVEGGLVDDLGARLAVPAHAVEAVLGAALLQHDAHCVGEADGVVRRVAREEEHVTLADDDVLEHAVVHHLEHHGALVLVEPLGGLVDVVVCAGVGAAYDLARSQYSGLRGVRREERGAYHGGEAIIVNAVVVDGRLEKVRVLL
jgi:hypothetical protein